MGIPTIERLRKNLAGMLICTYKEQVCIKKDHEKFKILDILAVTTQAREGIETYTLGAG